MSELYKRIFGLTPQISSIRPSDYAQRDVIVPGKGKVNYDFNPYCRKIIDMLAPDHPARRIAIMKGSQITFSSGILMPALCYIIRENPCNTLFTVGKPALVKSAAMKLDQAIEGAGLKKYLEFPTKRQKNNKSGDTDEMKYFSGKYILLKAITETKSIAQMDLQRILLDDFDMMSGTDEETGAFLSLVKMRAAASKNDYKIMMISTPLRKESSNIEPAYLDGDQQRYFLECPNCHEPIIIEWAPEKGGGIDWKVNAQGQLIKSSVGYICQECGKFFNDRNKQNMLRAGIWKPTAIAKAEDYFSFHISSLYAPAGQFDWAEYVQQWLEAHPGGQEDRYKMQVFVNTCLGLPFESNAENMSATELMKGENGHIRSYKIGVVPDALSIADGNGRIILLTCAADLNGTKDDARLDYVVVAWSETGASYCVTHGSIGTFIPRENTIKEKKDRQPWTCELGRQFSVWDEFDRITRQAFPNEDGEPYYIDTPCCDLGHEGKTVTDYMDWTIGRYPDNPCVGVRGKGEGKYIAKGGNLRLFSVGLARNDTYFLEVGLFKDRLAVQMRMKWSEVEATQPPGFMNFPHSENGLFEFGSFFEHFEQEHRVLVESKTGGELFRWVKKRSNSQNHMFDCYVYNMAIREVIMNQVGRALIKAGRIPEKEFTWVDYANYMTGRYRNVA